MDQTEQKFLNDLDKKLWNAADRLRSNIDAAEYKHIVLGLIFLKFVSDAFVERKQEIQKMPVSSLNCHMPRARSFACRRCTRSFRGWAMSITPPQKAG